LRLSSARAAPGGSPLADRESQYAIAHRIGLDHGLERLDVLGEEERISIATARSNCGCTAGLHEVGKFTLRTGPGRYQRPHRLREQKVS